MKKVLVTGFFALLLVQISFAFNTAHIGLSLDAKTASYTTSISNFSATNNLDSMLGIGLVVKVPLRETLSLLFEGQYNTGSTFTTNLGVKTNISVYPLQLNIQDNLGGLYLGGGLNYTIWTLSAGSTSFSENNGFGYQLYAGLESLFGNLELKYTYMTASVTAFGATFDQAAGAISLGTKIWII